MLEPGSHPDFSLKALKTDHGGKVRVEHLERDLSAVLSVPREMNGRSPAPAEQTEHLVSGG
jgi:hypothetical protein